MKQHYVPQFYYRKFGDKVYCLDKTNENIFHTDPKNISFERDFYGPALDGKYPVEKILSQFEGRFNTSISELIRIEDFTKLPDEKKPDICTFAAIQYLRTKETRMRIIHMGNAFFSQVAKAQGVDDYTIQLTDEGSMGMHLERLLEFPAYALAMMQMKIVIAKNKTKIPLWTSDNPVAFQNELEQPGFGNLGFLSRGIEMHLPLSPKLMAVFFDPTIFSNLPSVIDLTDPQNIIRENYLQAISSTRFLISNTDEFHLAKDMLKSVPELKDPNRPRITTVKNYTTKASKPLMMPTNIVATKGPNFWMNPTDFEQSIKRFSKPVKS